MRLDKTLQKWDKVLLKPGWPGQIYAEFIKINQELESSPRFGVEKDKLRVYFESKLSTGGIFIDQQGPDQDQQRKPIDRVVIHHTSQPPGISLEKLETIHFLNIYLPEFFKQAARPVWSGHFYKGRQVFWGYHWLVRNNGSSQRILKDKYIGWQAGNWPINCRSVAICLDNDFEFSNPTNQILRGAAELIKEHYPQISPKNILGHCDCRNGTTCPGAEFAIWKHRLIELIYN